MKHIAGSSLLLLLFYRLALALDIAFLGVIILVVSLGNTLGIASLLEKIDEITLIDSLQTPFVNLAFPVNCSLSAC
jgi:hypothetical protein